MNDKMTLKSPPTELYLPAGIYPPVEKPEAMPWFGPPSFFFGRRSDESLIGDDRGNWIDGGDGEDWIDGWNGDDILLGGDGDDSLFGWNGDDVLDGEAGDDRLRGEQGDDVLIAGDGEDVLDGGQGDDRIDVSDRTFATDTVVYRLGDGQDVVTGFTFGEDVLDLRAFGFRNAYDFAAAVDISYSHTDLILTFRDGGSITLEDALTPTTTATASTDAFTAASSAEIIDPAAALSASVDLRLLAVDHDLALLLKNAPVALVGAGPFLGAIDAGAVVDLGGTEAIA